MTHRPPIVIAHRGASGYRPEHTLEAYELAIDLGADFVEPDLVATQEGVLIARHENELGATTDVALHPEFADRWALKVVDGVEVSGWFSEDFTLAEIKTLRARERLPSRKHAFDGRFEVPTFEEVLELVARKSREAGRAIGLYPETKRPSYFRKLGLPLEEPLLDALEAFGYRGRSAPVFLQSFETGNLRELRGRTDLPLVQLLAVEGAPWDLVAGDGGSARPGGFATYDDLASPDGLAEVATWADGIGPDKRRIVPLGLDGRLGPPTSLVDDAHRAGLLVHPWTFRGDAPFLAPEYPGPEAEIERFLELGVDGIFTDFPDVGVRARERRGGVT